MDITSVPTNVWDMLSNAAAMLATAIVAIVRVIFIW